MEYYRLATLSRLVQDTVQENRTQIQYLRLSRCRISRTTSVEVNNTFGDDILTQIITPAEQPPATDPGTPHGNCGNMIQILFVHSIRYQGSTTSRLVVTHPTLEQLCIRLGIGLPFLDGLLRPSTWSKQAGISFNRHNEQGEVEAIYGFYHYFDEWDLGPLHCWYAYNVKSGLTTYFLVDCPENVRRSILADAQDGVDSFIHRPFAIDFLISEACARTREILIEENRRKMFDWQENRSGMDPPLMNHVTTEEGVEQLHLLSRIWNMIFQDLTDFEERQDSVLEAARKLGRAGVQDIDSAVESFHFLKARNQVRRRWVSSFGERTRLVINFVFSQANRDNARTNTTIQGLTAEIAEEAQRDSSSMITIATMTMIFLPATFVCALFSMVFFSWGPDGNGNEIFHVSPWLGLFPAVTVPLTLLVIFLYRYWRKRRTAQMADRRANRSLDNMERGIMLQPL